MVTSEYPSSNTLGTKPNISTAASPAESGTDALSCSVEVTLRRNHTALEPITQRVRRAPRPNDYSPVPQNGW